MSELRVLIIESSYPNDFYSEKLDGPLTHHLVKLLGIQSRLIYALDRRHFEKAIVHGAEEEFDLVHVSCHGDENGLALTDNAEIGWETFVKFFADSNYSPKALIMSSCCGGASELGDAFKAAASRPKIIFGSTDERFYHEYAVAWAILYKAFRGSGVTRDVAKDALEAICAVVHKNFRYLRWDDDREKYLLFPGSGRLYEVAERSI